MHHSTPGLQSYATWQRLPPAADRWRALQAQISRDLPPAGWYWNRGSAVSCRWRALPALVSAAIPAAAG